MKSEQVVVTINNNNYRCKKCGKKGTKEELLNHICWGIEKHYEDENDDGFLNTLILISAISSLGRGDPMPSEPPLEGGGGEFSGGGASGESESNESESEPSDSGGGDSGGE